MHLSHPYVVQHRRDSEVLRAGDAEQDTQDVVQEPERFAVVAAFDVRNCQ